MPVLRRLGILSLAKVTAIIMAVIGLIVGVFFALFAGVGALSGMPMWFGGLGIAALILFPLLYAIIGFIYGAIVAAVYNVAASLVGGVELEFEG